jgi:hypothetical protein
LTAAQTQQTKPPAKAAPPSEVKAVGDNAIAVGRDLTIKENIEVHEYSPDKARSLDASRFAKSIYRECAAFVPMIDEVSLTGKKDAATVTMPSFLGPVYAMADTRRLMGDAVYKTLNAQQVELRSLQDQLRTMRMDHKMVAVHDMMDMQQRGDKPKQKRPPGPTEQQFTQKRQDFSTKTQAHCEYLKSLM